jgi:hypothetical protein
MAQPVWVTPAGNLGTIAEGVFYRTLLEAYDPDADTVYYSLLAGDLPAGMQINDTGIISGVPQAEAFLQGVPAIVSRDVVSKFAVRAYTRTVINGVTVINRLADRTFEFTVTGQDVPEFITPAGQIAQLYDGTLVEGIQIEYTDTDPEDTVIVRLKAGSLPTGLTLSPQGLISGLMPPNDPGNVNKNYEFTLEVTDGKVGGNNLRTFSIYVWAQQIMSAA